jgi:putative transposase
MTRAAKRLLTLEVDFVTALCRGAKSPLPLAQRNGHRERDIETHAGTIEPHIEKVRKGSHITGVLGRPTGVALLGRRLPDT